VTLSVEKKEEKVCIEYKENGTGISKEQKKKVFKIFGTIGTKTKENAGMGL